MIRTFLSRHFRKTADQRFKRRERLKVEIDNTFEKESFGLRMSATNITPTTKKARPFRPSSYTSQHSYATKFGIVVVWYADKLGTCSYIFIHEGDIIHTTFNFPKEYKFSMEDVALRFAGIVRDVYENTE